MIDNLKKRALHRSRILEGQMRGLEKMIENEEYCMDIITQSLSIQKSLRSLNKLLVENHLRTHVSDMFARAGAAGAGRRRAVEGLRAQQCTRETANESRPRNDRPLNARGSRPRPRRS